MELGKEKRHMVDFLFVLTLFFVFAISTLLLVIIGANVYKKTVDDMTMNYNSRTAYAYLTEKIRQNDREDAIEIGTFERNPAIILVEEIDGILYQTYLYLYDGSIRELFSRMDENLGPEAGQIIMPALDFTAKEIERGFYTLTITTTDKVTLPLYVGTRSNQK